MVKESNGGCAVKEFQRHAAHMLGSTIHRVLMLALVSGSGPAMRLTLFMLMQDACHILFIGKARHVGCQT